MKALVVMLAACSAAPEPDAWQFALPPGFAPPHVPADNPMSADKVELGRRLFYDVRLSGNGTQACASCHDPARAFTDGRATPLGSTGAPGRHNAMSLANVGYEATLTWATTQPALEDQALVPMFGDAPVELAAGDVVGRIAGEPIYDELFANVFDGDVSIANVTRAIAAFERTLISGGSRFDRFLAGDRAALDDAEQRGLELFESPRLGCTHCHGGFDLSGSALGDPVFFNTGLYAQYPASDRGLVETTGDPADEGRFKPPTLRNIAVTAPYMHDGSIATLDAVLDHYASGGAAHPNKSAFVTGFSLTAGERADLLAFFGALTDDGFLANPASSNPW